MAGTWKTKIEKGWQDGRSGPEERKLLLLCFAAVFGFGLAAHAYGFLNASFSHDMLNALVADPVETYWKMQLGRPGIVLYRRLFRGLIAAPWQLGLLSLLWLSLGCYLTAKLFRVPSRLFPVLLGGVLTVSISTVAMTATYLYEMDADLFAALLGVCAVFLWDRYGWPGAVLGALLTACCMGTYQSMVSVPVTLAMLLSIAALLRGEGFAPVLRKGLRALGMLGLGALLWWLGVRLMCSVKGINLAMDGYNSVDQAVSASLLERIGHVYRSWIWAFWNPKKAHIEPVVLALNSLLALLGLGGLLSWLAKGKAGGKEKLLLCLLVLLLPLGMNTAQLSFSRDVHDLMKFSFWFFYVLCLLPVFTAPAEKPSGFVSGAAAVLVLMLLCSNIQTANIVYTKKTLEQEAAQSLMTRVLYRLEEREDYVPGQTELVFAGVSDQLNGKLPGFEAYYDITGCEESSPIVKSAATYSYNAYAAYFRYILNSPARMADWEQWNRLQDDPRVQQMKAYPADGCMQLLDGTMVVKMGEKEEYGG
ncbi:MAG: glucosyltransferase domain-containing protein [Oscillospiraceae bacterium]|nr:glucosyltransferase domain-containing protein [Oscillospiraceae bacterium]